MLLNIYLLGTPRFVSNGRSIPIQRRKIIALLAYLAQTNNPHSRESLATLLWPEHNQSAALKNLRRELSRLKKSVADELIIADRLHIGLNPEHLATDVRQFETAVSLVKQHNHFPQQKCPDCLEALTTAVSLHNADFMSGFNLPDAPEFDEWQYYQRESLRQALGESLQKLISWHSQQAEWEQGINYSRHWLSLDNLHEPAHRELMQLYASAGQHAAALRQYQSCEQILADELGVDPEPDTIALYEAIRNREFVPQQRKPAVPIQALSSPSNDRERFTITKPLATGGHGRVYLGLDQQTGDTVVIKRLKEEVASHHPEFVRRFQREGELLQQLDHPNVIKILGTFEQDERHHIVMEYVEGGTLEELIQKNGRLPLPRVLDIGLELADALSRTHHLGIIHRDIKPSNVLIAKDGTPRLTDFGLARLIRQDSNLTHTGVFIGSPTYVSPEVLQNERLDTRSDIWSFGILLYEMIAGQPPFQGQHMAALLSGILNAPTPVVTNLRDDIPPALAQLLAQMLTKDRNHRLGSMRLVSAELEAILAGKTESALPTFIPTSPTVVRQLPKEATPLIGRQREIDAIDQLLIEPSCRFVTIIGPGGMGKTRLSLAVASQIDATDFADGIYFLPLAVLQTADLILPALAETLGLAADTENLQKQLTYFLHDKRMLLVMDNFEHLLDGASIVSQLLEAAPHLKIIATSRERLNLAGERIFALHGLAFPAGETAVSPEKHTAIQLFIQQARMVQPGFAAVEQDWQPIARICQLVEGVPLALVLAASWLEALSLSEIAAEITDSLDFLETDGRDVPARQRSVRAVFETSWKRLADQEQETYKNLSVFQGGFTRQAAQAVAKANIRVLRRLVNKSLLRLGPNGRYDILELLRQYAEEKLNESSSDASQKRDRHSAYYGSFLESLQNELNSQKQQEALQKIAVELANVRSGWQWALSRLPEQPGWVDTVAQYVIPVFHVYDTRSRFQEGEEAFRQAAHALEKYWRQSGVSPITPKVLGQVLGRQGWFAFHLGQQETAVYLLQHSLALLSNSAQPSDRIFSLNYLGAVQMHRGNYDAAQTHLEDCLAICRQTNNRFGTSVSLNILARIAYLQGDYARAIERCRESIAIKQALGDEWGITFSLTYLGLIAQAQGRHEEAANFFNDSLAISERVGDRRGVATSLTHLGDLAASQGDTVEAQQYYQRSLTVFEEIHHLSGAKTARQRLASVDRNRINAGR
ncbi:MAG: protein kinase [Chloroflexota bacterium]